MSKRLFALLLPALFAVPALAESCTVPLLELDADGRVLSGSRRAVADAARRGDPLRVGWRVVYGRGERDFVQHWSEARFVTLFEGETFAQVEAIHRQAPRRGKAHVELTQARETWHASIGTDGVLAGRPDNGDPTETRVAQSWCLAGEAAARCTTPSWREVYRHDTEGRPLAGAKDTLFAAIRRGDPLRVTWGMSAKDGAVSVEHAAEPVFVTIASDGEAYVQLPEHGLQTSYAEPGKVRIGDPAVLWRAVMGTDGTFDAHAVDRTDGDPATHLPQRVALRWLAYAPDPACDPRPVPALAVPGGVVRASH